MSEHLGSIQSPADIKRMSIAELAELAEEIRELLISSLSKTGGHLGPNLGVVELTLAMHYVFDTPVDRFLFDVSHQTYVHKLLTGRADRFHTIRQPGGLNGFMLRTESEHDAYGAGHAGTALPPLWAWQSRAISLEPAKTLWLWQAMPPSPTAFRLRR